ncbi:hypothetical protein MRX96_052202 [Rhipicephalus microplus]
MVAVAHRARDGLPKLKLHSRLDTFLSRYGVPDGGGATRRKVLAPRKAPSSSTCSHENGRGTDCCLCTGTRRRTMLEPGSIGTRPISDLQRSAADARVDPRRWSCSWGPALRYVILRAASVKNTRHQ